MGFIKKKSLAIFGILLVCIVMEVTFCVSGKEISEEKWIKENSTSLDIKDNNEFSGFNILKKDLDNNEVFLTGEFHGAHINDELSLKFFKFLNKEAGVRYYLMELSVYNGELINKYLETGDKIFLEKIMLNHSGSSACSKELYNEFQELYKFNKELPKNEKIKIIPVDYAGDIGLYFEHLNMIVDRHSNRKQEVIKEFKDLYKNYLETINDSDYYDEFQLCAEEEKNILKLIEDLKQRESLYKEYFEKDFEQFKYLTKNFCYFLHFKNLGELKTIEGSKYRDKILYENFKSIYSKLPKGKYYGHFGDNHVLKQGVSLGKLMDKDDKSLVKGKVLSVFTNYVDSYALNYEFPPDYKGKLPTVFNEKLLSEIKFSQKSNVMFLKLEGKRSPFKNKNLDRYLGDDGYYSSILNNMNVTVKKPITDYFNYIIVINKDKPNTSYENFEEEKEEFDKYKEEINKKLEKAWRSN